MTRFLWGGESIYGELPPDALDRAKENVADVWFVGFRERLDESIVLLGRKLGIGLMPYYLRHVSTKRPPIEETSRELRELVAEHNSLDVELYRFARELFEQSAPPPDELTDDIAELRRRSVEVTQASAAQRKTQKEQGKQRRRDRKAAGLSRRPTGKPAAEGGGSRRATPGGSPGQKGSRGGVSTGTRKTPVRRGAARARVKLRVSRTLFTDFSWAA